MATQKLCLLVAYHWSTNRCVPVSVLASSLCIWWKFTHVCSLQLWNFRDQGWHCLWQMVHMCVLCVLLSAKNHRTCTEYWLISMQLHREVQRGNKDVLNKYVSIVWLLVLCHNNICSCTCVWHLLCNCSLPANNNSFVSSVIEEWTPQHSASKETDLPFAGRVFNVL